MKATVTFVAITEDETADLLKLRMFVENALYHPLFEYKDLILKEIIE